MRFAFTAELLVRLLGSRKGHKPTARDFLTDLPWRREHIAKRPQTPAELRAKVNATMRMLGGR